MIDPELEATILRLHHAEKWPPGTIAAQLAIHHDVVNRALKQDGVPLAQIVRRCMIDPFVPFIASTLRKYPRLTAARLFQMVQERGYPGKPDHFRSILTRYRPSKPVEAYLRLKTLPGDEAQVDWGNFGKIQIGLAARPLVAFVIVLSYSRGIFLRFYPSQQLSNFLSGHQDAFERWEGVPRTLLYDNLKSVVLDRVGDAIRFNPQILAFAKHYRYEPRPVAPYRGNEKGRVERAIRYVRDNFFPARSFDSFEDINTQADLWCRTVADERLWPELRDRTVAEAALEDIAALRALPQDPFPCHERKEVHAGKTPYVRFDLNDYSIPHTHVRKTLVILADLSTIRVLDGNDVIAEHDRSFDRGQQIENPKHIEDLWTQKTHARKSSSSNRLAQCAPSSARLLKSLANRHEPLGRHTAELNELLQSYGPKKLEHAIQEVLFHDAPHPQGVRHVLERDREAEGQEPVLPLPFADDPRIDKLGFTPHSLEGYDEFLEDTDEEDDQ